MKKPYDKNISDLRSKIIGLGEKSHKKNYYPELQKKLKELERFKTIFGQSNDLFFHLDFPSTQILDSNESINSILGYSQSLLIGKPFIEILSTNTQRKLTDFFSIVSTKIGNERTIEGEFIKENGSILPVEIKLKLVEFKKKQYIIAVARDISRRKLIEAEMEANRRKYNEIFNSSSEAVFIHDGNTGKILEVNQAMLTMFGYEKDEISKLDVGDLSESTEDSQAEAEKLIKKSVTEGPQTFEWRSRKKSGELFWAEVSLKGTEILGEKRVIAVVRDISNRKKSEEKLIEAQKMDSIGNLAAGVAHDFNNMLSGILGFSSLLLNGETNPEKRDFLKGIINSANRAADLTKKLLAFGRKGKNISEPIGLNQTIKDVLNLLRRSIDDADEIKVSANLAPDLSLIDGDPSQLNQVIMNLCINAREAMPKGGKLSISSRNISNSENLSSKFPELEGNEFIEIIVQDTGHGISPEIRKKIFEPFFTTKKEGDIKGTGLGLAMVYGIVKNHRGTIDLQSKVNQGTAFKIYLPKGCNHAQIAKSNEKKKNIELGNETILIIEDEKMVLMMGQKILQRLGYSVLTAKNGSEGLEIYKKNKDKIAAILLDMKMPQMDGRTCFLEMKKLNPEVKVLLTTGYGNNEEAQKLLDFGVKDLLIKPYKVDSLASKLKKIIHS